MEVSEKELFCQTFPKCNTFTGKKPKCSGLQPQIGGVSNKINIKLRSYPI